MTRFVCILIFTIYAVPFFGEKTLSLKGPMDDHIVTTSGFSKLDSGEIVKNDVEISGEYDENFILLNIKCYEDQMNSIQVRHLNRDSDVWQDDCIEIFIDPGNTDRSYWHLIVNPKAGFLDEYCSRKGACDRRKDIDDLAISMTYEEDGWLASILIPVDTITHLNPEGGDEWGINFARHEITREGSVYSSWAPLDGASFHTPEKFGVLKFGTGKKSEEDS